ncbi:MAG: D-tyrosyl-tRNA(Tyr) deacylase [Acidobacteria bacterium]|nr:D-tyrosyl-tRNA(Tyr) deacylase [Acidobacteriota bacterium]
MRIVAQRVSHASVEVEGKVVGEVGHGLVLLVCAIKGDTKDDADYLAEKVAGLRVFSDAAGKFNLSILDTAGSALAISQFTLAADCKKGRRPSFDLAAPSEEARILFHQFVEGLRAKGVPVATGIFQATMSVRLTNEGPVTLLLDSRKGS